MTHSRVCLWPSFQSTRPHGARLPTTPRRTWPWPVSIHAPARGATWPCLVRRAPRPGFNPRARTGRDLGRWASLSPPWRFNPRARTGRDSQQYFALLRLVVFQSTRPHGARRGEVSAEEPLDVVSIHAPARGATASTNTSASVREFQSTRPHGARPHHLARMLRGGIVSIHAPARGATVNICRNITLRIASMQVIHHERLECAPVAQYTSKKMREPPGTTPSLGVRANTQCVK